MRRLHHVNVVVPEAATEDVLPFYTDVLGLRRTTKPAEGTSEGGAWLDVDDHTQVHVSERAGGSPHPDQHFGLIVDDFDDVLARLARAGAEWNEQADLFGGRRGWTRDPVGNRVEILERSGRLA